jgi:very-short-patch-repair endonuclease
VLTPLATVAYCLRDLSVREALSVGDSALKSGKVELPALRARIVIECDGFETHGTLDAMTGDCVRHTLLGAAGWRTLRFTWYQVMHRPDWVLERVRDTIVAAGC